MSTHNPSHGTKVTDPSAPEIQERAGAVASDSLAAESTRAGGGFADNRGAEPLGVSGQSSTFATTDTTGAQELDSAPSRPLRDSDDGEKYPDASGQSKATAVTDTTGSYSTGGATSSAGTAPTYVDSQYQDSAGPKGQNLREGGFDSNDAKNASWNTDIGSKNDPGRLAEQKFDLSNSDNAQGFRKQEGDLGDGQYDSLNRDESA